jgi:hypothetical protein
VRYTKYFVITVTVGGMRRREWTRERYMYTRCGERVRVRVRAYERGQRERKRECMGEGGRERARSNGIKR